MGFGEVALDDSAFHFVWGLAGRDVWNALWVVVLEVVDPTWGAGSDLWEDTAFGDTVNELLGLFHDGKVSSEVGIEDTVESESVEGGDHLAGGIELTDLVAEFLSKGGTDGWSGLDDDELAFRFGLVDAGDFAFLA